MTLSAEARERLADIVALQPTKNSELQDRWDMESGSEVHRYLESELKDYYYRDDNSLIRATPEAADVADVEPGIVEDGEGGQVIRVPPLEHDVLTVLPDHDEEPRSVVAVLHDVRDEDPGASVEDVREALRGLAGKGVVERISRTVPTYRLATARDRLTVEERSAR